MKLWLKVAFLCWFAPCAAGVSIFALWKTTYWSWLRTAGMLTIVIGTVLALVGFLALTQFWSLSVRARDEDRDRMRLLAGLCLVLLASNFPLAWSIAVRSIH